MGEIQEVDGWNEKGFESQNIQWGERCTWDRINYMRMVFREQWAEPKHMWQLGEPWKSTLDFTGDKELKFLKIIYESKRVDKQVRLPLFCGKERQQVWKNIRVQLWTTNVGWGHGKRMKIICTERYNSKYTVIEVTIFANVISFVLYCIKTPLIIRISAILQGTSYLHNKYELHGTHSMNVQLITKRVNCWSTTVTDHLTISFPHHLSAVSKYPPFIYNKILNSLKRQGQDNKQIF